MATIPLVLLHFDGADLSTTITNEGNSNNVFTATSPAKLSTAQSKFGTASLQPSTPGGSGIVRDLNFGSLPSNSWTIDVWARFSTITTNQALFAFQRDANPIFVWLYHSSATLAFQLTLQNNAGYIANDVSGVKNNYVANQWYHFELTFDEVNSKYIFYVDGVADLTFFSSQKLTATDLNLHIGNNWVQSDGWGGYMDEFRITGTCEHPDGISFATPTAAYVGVNKGNASLTLPTKTLQAGVNPGLATITLPVKAVAAGVFGVGLPTKTLQASGGQITTTSEYVVGSTGGSETGGTAVVTEGWDTYYPVLGGARLSGSATVATETGPSLIPVVPDFTASFVSYVGGIISVDIQTPWAAFASTALLGSTATLDATTDFVQSTFEAVEGPFGLDVTLPVAQASMSASVGTIGTLKVRVPQLVARITGEGTYSATFAVQVALPTAAFTAIRGATASMSAKIPLPRAAMVAQLNTVAGGMSSVTPVVTSAFNGYTQYTASFAVAIPKLVATLDADSYYVFSQTLVINTTTHAVAEYANYAFNSFCEFNGAYYAADANGVFLLDTGDVDHSSAAIPANITTGDLDFGSEFQKRVPDIYAALRSTGDMAVTVSMDGQTTYQYALTTHGVTRLKQRRAKIGKGQKGKYCRVGLANVGGADFDLDTINIAPTPSKGRI